MNLREQLEGFGKEISQPLFTTVLDERLHIDAKVQDITKPLYINDKLTRERNLMFKVRDFRTRRICVCFVKEVRVDRFKI